MDNTRTLYLLMVTSHFKVQSFRAKGVRWAMYVFVGGGGIALRLCLTGQQAIFTSSEADVIQFQTDTTSSSLLER